MAEFKRTTRVKRDFPLFRERLRSAIEESGMTQVEAATKCNMDARTFNHVVSGPTHPDLQLITDIGGKLGFNLNYLFGLSDRKGNVPDDIDVHNYFSIDFYETHDGADVQAEKAKKGKMIVPKDFFRSVIALHGASAESIYGMRISETDCDIFSKGNPTGYFKRQDYITKKQVYSLSMNGKNYLRWVEKQLGKETLTISSNTLMQGTTEMEPEDVQVLGMLFRVTKDT